MNLKIFVEDAGESAEKEQFQLRLFEAFYMFAIV